MVEYAVFDTAIGSCALAWTLAGLCGAWLPEADAEATRAQVLTLHPDAVPTTTRQPAVDRVIGLLAGEPDPLTDLPLDPAGVRQFNQAVYAETRTIPPGQTITYGQLAARIGQPGAARAVGRALGENPYPIVVPCHRVLAAGGAMHGFSAPGGIHTKRRMLQIEQAIPADEPTLF